MQKYCISVEKEGYAKLHSINFGELDNVKDKVIEYAQDIYESWDEVFGQLNLRLVPIESYWFLMLRGYHKKLSTNGKHRPKKNTQIITLTNSSS